MPNSHASSTRGASVSWTSHSGITTLSSTWLVLRIPSKKDIATNPRLRSTLGRLAAPARRPAALGALGAVGMSCGASGSRVISSALRARIAAVNTGTDRITVSLLVASARPPISAPTVKPMLRALRMKASERTRSSRGKTLSV